MKIIYFLRLSKTHNAHVGNKTYPVFWCQECDTLVVDKLRHAQRVHEAQKVEVVNEFEPRGKIGIGKKKLVVEKHG